MTGMSDASRPPQTSSKAKSRIPSVKRRELAARAGWHVACMMGLQGCPYLLPVWVPVNRPPAIVQPATPTDLVFVLDGEVNSVTVLARDEDGDPLTFSWFPPAGSEWNAVDGSTAEGLYFSTFSLTERNPDLDRETIVLAVSDGQVETLRTWTILLPGDA